MGGLERVLSSKPVKFLKIVVPPALLMSCTGGGQEVKNTHPPQGNSEELSQKDESSESNIDRDRLYRAVRTEADMLLFKPSSQYLKTNLTNFRLDNSKNMLITVLPDPQFKQWTGIKEHGVSLPEEIEAVVSQTDFGLWIEYPSPMKTKLHGETNNKNGGYVKDMEEGLRGIIESKFKELNEKQSLEGGDKPKNTQELLNSLLSSDLSIKRLNSIVKQLVETAPVEALMFYYSQTVSDFNPTKAMFGSLVDEQQNKDEASIQLEQLYAELKAKNPNMVKIADMLLDLDQLSKSDRDWLNQEIAKMSNGKFNAEDVKIYDQHRHTASSLNTDGTFWVAPGGSLANKVQYQLSNHGVKAVD